MLSSQGMKRLLEVIVLLFVVVTTRVCSGLSDYCKEQCCTKSTNQTSINYPLGNETQNITNCTIECRQLQGSEGNITLQQICSLRKNLKEVDTSNKLFFEIDCQEMFDRATKSAIVGKVKRVKINFENFKINLTDYWFVNVTWDALNDTKNAKNWSHYAVQWLSGGKNGCSLVSKNQTFLVINDSKDGWEYPERIELNVSTYPLKVDTGYRYGIWGVPKWTGKIPVPVTPPSEINVGTLAAITVGCSAGVILFIMLIISWKLNLRVQTAGDIWRKYLRGLKSNQRSHIRSTQSELTIVEEDSQYVSYYLENEEYKKIVVNIVKTMSEMGCNVKLNLMNTVDMEQEGPNRWAQQQITNSSKVIVLCSPTYIKICQRGVAALSVPPLQEESRVWFEIQLLGNIYSRRKSSSKMVCVWMNEGIPDGLPPWMNKKYTWPQDLVKILDRLETKDNRRITSNNIQVSTPDNRKSNEYAHSQEVDDDAVFDASSPI